MIVFCYQFCALCTCNSGLFRIQVLLRMKEVAFFLAHTAQYSNPRTQHEQEHSTVTLVGAQNCNAQSSTQHTNCKATASSTLVHLLLK